MNIEEFFFWLKGFSEAANPYNITPKQWETILDTLNNVKVKKDDNVNNVQKINTPDQKSKYTDGSVYVSTPTYPIGSDSNNIKIMLID